MKNGKYPEAIVGAFIRNRKGEFLFCKSHKWKNLWTIPGGHVELGEKMVDALRREVMEEVGLEVEPIRLLDIQEAIFPKGFSRKKHFIFFNFLCTCRGEKVRIDRDEIQEYAWKSASAAMKDRHNEYTKHTLRLLTLGDGYEVTIPPEIEKKILG